MTDALPSSQFAAVLYRTTWLAIIALYLIAGLIWLFWESLAPMILPPAAYGIDLLSVGLAGQLGGFALSIIGVTVQAYGLVGLAQMFKEGAYGRPLSSKSVAGFRRFAWVTLLMVPLRVALTTATTTWLSVTDAMPGNSLSIRIGSDELGALFLALALVFAAQVFMRGHSAEQENQAFI